MSRHTPFRIAVIIAIGATVFTLSACGGAQARKVKHLERGKTYLAAGNLEKARVEFQNALQIAPSDPEARYEVGIVDEKLGRIQEAAQFFQGTLDIDRAHLQARTHLARLYIFSAVPNKALELIKPGLDAHPDDSELLTLRAAARVQQKDMSEAQADAERAVQLDPANADAVSTLAGIYSSQKDFDKARALLEQGIKRSPKSADLRLVLAQVYAGENRMADAENTLLELVQLEPGTRSHRIRLAQFYASQKQLDAAEHVLRAGIKEIPGDRDLKLSLIDFLAIRRSPELAEKELVAMIAADPKDFDMKFALAKFYEANGQSPRAESIYRQVIQSENLNAAGLAARDRLAALLVQRNDKAGAEKLMAEVLAKSPRDNEALILRGTLALASKDPKSAIADLRTVLRDQPNATAVLRALALAHLANGETAIGEETMRRAVETNPKDPGIRLDLAQVLARLGKPEQAEPILVDIVKEQPNNTTALNLLFRVSAANKDDATAQSAAAGLVAAAPKASVGYLFEGLMAEQANRSEDALRLYAQAVDLQPDALEPLDAQIRILVKMKRPAEAMKRLDEITARAPTAPFAAFIKGELLYAQKDLEGAQAAYRLAIARIPTWWQPYHGLADAQFAAKKPDDALATLRRGQTAAGDKEPLSLEIARYLERSGKIDEALREYDAIEAADPQSEVAANNLAMLLVTYKKDTASIERAKALTARFADSGNPSYLDTYGWVLFKHGETAASVSVLQQVVSKAPDEPVLRYHLGMAESQAGSATDAVTNLTRAVNSGRKFTGLDEAKAALDKLAKLQPDLASKT
jgi:tetratricopeptide (TPR) repeat protein